MHVYPLPGHVSSVSPPGHCSGSMSAAMEDTLMSHVSWGDSAFPPVSEASGYGNKVLFTPVSASQGWCRWPAPTRLQLQTTLETNPEVWAPLGWEIEFESVCCSYQASTGSDGIELRHDQLRIMSPLKSKQTERSSHVHPASVAHESQTSNFADFTTLHSERTGGCLRELCKQRASYSAFQKALHLYHPTYHLTVTAAMQQQKKKKGSGTAQKQAAKAAPAAKAQRARAKKYAAPAAPTRKKQGNGAQPRRKIAIPHFLDPLCAMPAPSVTSDGKALPHTGLVSGDFVVGSTNTTLLLVTNVGDAGTVGAVLNVSPHGEYVDGLQLFTIPTLAQADAAGGPSAARAMKFSVSVVNCSNALKRGGRVTYLNSSQRLPSLTEQVVSETLPNVESWSAVIQGIKSSPYRRRVTGDCLGVGPGGKATHIIGYPVDTVAYTSFLPFHGTLGWSEFREYLLGASSTPVVNPPIEPRQRPMSILAYIFDPVSENQDYSVTIRASYYTRWPLTSVPGQSMRKMPTSDAAVINHVRDHAEATANDLAHVVEGGALATIGPRVAGAARSGLGRIGGMLRSAGTSAVEAMEGATTDLLGTEGAALASDALLLL